MTEQTSSIMKIEANKRNAAKSTGPRTEEGKRAVRHNALKHGILTEDIVIESGFLQEDRTEFAALIEALREDLGPEGPLEAMLVERIAGCCWRLRRVYRAESGGIISSAERSERVGLLDKMGDTEAHFELITHLLPQRLTTDNILRYETTIERQLYRTLDELKKLQRERLGEGFRTPENLAISGE